MAQYPPEEELSNFIETCIPEPRVVNVYVEHLNQVRQLDVFVVGTAGRRAYRVSESRKKTPLSHDGLVWGDVYYGYTLERIGEYEPALYHLNPDGWTTIDVAIKRLDKRIFEPALARGGRENPYREIHRMQTDTLLDGGYILPMKDALEDDRYLYIITPFADCGDLNSFVPLRPRRYMSVELQAYEKYKQMLDAIDHIHNNPHVHGQFGIGHRDIKGSNFFVFGDRVLLADFAMSYPIPSGDMVKHIGMFGTSNFLPPEIFEGNEFSARGCDLWACTVTLFNMVTGMQLYRRPVPTDLLFVFNIMARGMSNEPHVETIEIILEEVDAECNSVLRHLWERLQRLSPPLRELLSNVLTRERHSRWNIQDVRRSAWMQQAASVMEDSMEE